MIQKIEETRFVIESIANQLATENLKTYPDPRVLLALSGTLAIVVENLRYCASAIHEVILNQATAPTFIEFDVEALMSEINKALGPEKEEGDQCAS